MNRKVVKKKITTIGKLLLWSIGIILLSNTSFFIIVSISKAISSLWFIALILLLVAFAFVLYIYIMRDPKTLRGPEREHALPAYRRYYSFWFTILSIILLIALCSFAIWGITKLFKTYPIYKFLLNNNLLLSFIVVFTLLQFAVRKHIILNQSWKKLSDVWLKFTGIPAISVGGFGIAGLFPELKNRIVKIALEAEYVNLKLVVSVYIITIIVLGLAYLLILLGRSISNDEDSNAPMKWFIPTFSLVWISNLGIYTVFFDCIFLTLQAHIST